MPIHQVRTRIRSLAVVASALTLIVGVAACGDDPPATPPPSFTPTSRSALPSPTPTATSKSSATEGAGQNDLGKLPLERRISEGLLSVNVQYTTRLPVDEWLPGVRKPLRVTLTAINRRDRAQNIYLQRATADVTAYGDNGFVEKPEPVADLASITPGFIVKSPNTYNQVFNLPAVDDASRRLTIDFTYELTVQVSEQREFGDYAKQVATDTIVVPLA